MRYMLPSLDQEMDPSIASGGYGLICRGKVSNEGDPYRLVMRV